MISLILEDPVIQYNWIIFPFSFAYCNRFCTCTFILLALYKFLMLFIALRESEKTRCNLCIFESMIKCMALRIAYDSAVNIEQILESL